MNITFGNGFSQGLRNGIMLSDAIDRHSQVKQLSDERNQRMQVMDLQLKQLRRVDKQQEQAARDAQIAKNAYGIANAYSTRDYDQVWKLGGFGDLTGQDMVGYAEIKDVPQLVASGQFPKEIYATLGSAKTVGSMQALKNWLDKNRFIKLKDKDGNVQYKNGEMFFANAGIFKQVSKSIMQQRAEQVKQANEMLVGQTTLIKQNIQFNALRKAAGMGDEQAAIQVAQAHGLPADYSADLVQQYGPRAVAQATPQQMQAAAKNAKQIEGASQYLVTKGFDYADAKEVVKEKGPEAVLMMDDEQLKKVWEGAPGREANRVWDKSYDISFDSLKGMPAPEVVKTADDLMGSFKAKFGRKPDVYKALQEQQNIMSTVVQELPKIAQEFDDPNMAGYLSEASNKIQDKLTAEPNSTLAQGLNWVMGKLSSDSPLEGETADQVRARVLESLKYIKANSRLEDLVARMVKIRSGAAVTDEERQLYSMILRGGEGASIYGIMNAMQGFIKGQLSSYEGLLKSGLQGTPSQRIYSMYGMNDYNRMVNDEGIQSFINKQIVPPTQPQQPVQQPTQQPTQQPMTTSDGRVIDPNNPPAWLEKMFGLGGE